jgi:formylglycine-generating enzyme required for sulfatase activity
MPAFYNAPSSAMTASFCLEHDMTPRNLALGLALTLVATTAAAKSTPSQGGIYPDVIQHPVPTDLSVFKQPASLVADIKAIQAGTLQQRLEALKAKALRDQVFVKGGTFQMGDFGRLQSKEHLPWDNNSNSSPLHKVTLTSYSIGKYLVTKAEADLYSEANHLPLLGGEIRDVLPSGGNIAGTWGQASAYCQWLGKLTGRHFDLPTEAQWEYAARDRGRFIVYPTDNGKIEFNRNVITYDLGKKLSTNHKMWPIAITPPSLLGLYDMTGSSEWMRDWYSTEYYSHSSNVTDPGGPADGKEKVLRGDGNPSYSMTMHREHGDLDKMHATIRCVVDSSAPVN